MRDQPPKYRQIAEVITNMIEAGEFTPGGRILSVSEIRKRFEVSITTAERVLYELELSGLVIRKKGSGTYLKETGGSLPRPARTWGYVMPAINTHIPSLYAKIIRGIEEVAHENNVNLIVANSHDIPERQDIILQRMMDSDVSGVIVTPHMKPDPSFTTYLQLLHRHIPFVFCNRRVSGINAPLVTANHQKGGYLAARHLLELGHRRIGFVSPPRSLTAAERFAGFLAALQEEGIEWDEKIFLWMDRFENLIDNVREAAKVMLARERPPEAVFACSDPGAYGFYQAMKELGLACPDDIALVGHDDIDPPRGFDLHLTTVAYPAYESGKRCAELLLRMEAGELLGLTEQVVLEPELRVRQSTVKVPEEEDSPSQAGVEAETEIGAWVR